MRSAYALLGLTFLIVFLAAYILFEKAQAPQELPENLPANLDN